MGVGLVKTLALRESEGRVSASAVNARSHSLVLGSVMGAGEAETWTRPRLLAVDGEEGEGLPAELALSATQLRSEGVYLLDNGVDMFVYVGREAKQDILQQWFIQTHDGIALAPDTDQADPGLRRLHRIIEMLRSNSPYWQRVRVVREGEQPPTEMVAMLTEDAQGNTLSLQQFATLMNKN
jgi:protein transport protein SEC24